LEFKDLWIVTHLSFLFFMLSFLNSLLRSVRNYFWIFIFSKIVPNPTKKELESEKMNRKKSCTRIKTRVPGFKNYLMEKSFSCVLTAWHIQKYSSSKYSQIFSPSLLFFLLISIPAFNIAYWHRKYHSGTICKGVSNPQSSKALSVCEKEEIPK